MTVFEPRQFGKYQLLDQIAVGGMAELYRAKLTGVQGFEKLIAIKKILAHLSTEENLVTSFIDEAKLAALLHHENIVQIYDFGNLDGDYYIAMEYLFGKDLRAIIQKAAKTDQPLGMENILYIAIRICAGLDYSHTLKDLQGKALNIIHRDINPQNVLVTYEGQVKIIDFGIAKAASHNSKTKENLIKGKLAYMSPEQANGGSIDHRSDIFSTGIILYELLADRRMFQGETLHILSLVREAQYDPPAEVIADLPPKLNAILLRALAKAPEDRYQSCGEMLADLEECAFQLSLRPNSRSFARYMKSLFEDEFAEEELALWAKTQIYAAGEPDDLKAPPAKERNPDDTISLTKTIITEKLKRLKKALVTRTLNRFQHAFQSPVMKRLNTRYAALVLAILFLAGLGGLGLKKLSFSSQQREVASHSAKPAEAVETAGLEAVEAAVQAKRYAQATTLIEEILTAQPSTRAKVSSLYVQALEGQAAEIIETNPKQAQALLLKALEIDPVNISGLSRLGYLYVNQQDYASAIETYRRVAELDPRLPDTFFNLGYVFAITENLQQAKAMYNRVVELAPKFTDEALFNLAVIHEKLGERDQCIQRLEQALAMNPGNESAKNFLYKITHQAGDKG